ncbi:hypothetical protein K0M31_006383 [Melipona bicolor]|uniref:Uncharacterized protein n=1 Tax=Melipona bicolor TaxID=60889 RepID=A0AA40FTG1_9HYME|nr:hypothetical protein K0M31_006383 [Melipona bicolor]
MLRLSRGSARCLARLVIRLQGRSELLGNGIAMEMGTKMGPSAVGCGNLVAAVATVSPLSFNSPSSSSALVNRCLLTFSAPPPFFYSRMPCDLRHFVPRMQLFLTCLYVINV